MVVLSAQVEVAEKDRRLAARDHQNHEHQEKEAEHVIRLTVGRRTDYWKGRRSMKHRPGPNGVQDEKELYEDAAEGQDATHDHAGNGLCVH